MSKLSSYLVRSINGRCYSARAPNVQVSAAVPVRTDGTTAMVTAAGTAKAAEVFWMRDPKTGYWVPENRFDEVDAVELRNQLLPKLRGYP